MAVDAVVSILVEKLAYLLVQEAVFLRGVKDQVEWVRAELIRMQCFLKDADEKQGGDARVKNWVAEIRDVAYDAEDIIDNFILKKEQKQRRRRTEVHFHL
ncbi:hypothetical protein HHK36_025382 [Tetracentron sinense]|uniref:Disease resistance N-terminal domain-containing protein n=1 Tax=Tetracentron sinense TaxID=13715 RepID=A0A834YMI6_TETSI|nr:hypothetical protein HHK36_025382 [Tetracentron sinense]